MVKMPKEMLAINKFTTTNDSLYKFDRKKTKNRLLQDHHLPQE